MDIIRNMSSLLINLVLELTSINHTQGHKNFSFCEQTLHKGLIDASCNWLQSTRKIRGQHKILRTLRAKIQFLRLLFSSLRNISSYNPHTILKKCATRSTKKYIYFYLQKLQVGPGDAACQERQYATKNMARTKFSRKIWRFNLGFCAPDQGAAPTKSPAPGRCGCCSPSKAGHGS
jgi:hypothetical protein